MGRTHFTDVDIELFGTAGIDFADGTRQDSAIVQQTEVTLESADIIGTSAGQLGHADGVELVPAQGEDQLIELISVLGFAKAVGGPYGNGDNLVCEWYQTGIPISEEFGSDILLSGFDYFIIAGRTPSGGTESSVGDLTDDATNKGVNILTPTPFTNPGALQIETATIVEDVPGTLTSGNATVTVTAAGLTGSPVDVLVALATNDSQNTVATKIRAALAANTAINSFFTVGGATNAVILTARTKAADDSTMNIAYANTTCAGLTDDPTSVHTTAGALDAEGTITFKTSYRVHDLS